MELVGFWSRLDRHPYVLVVMNLDFTMYDGGLREILKRNRWKLVIPNTSREHQALTWSRNRNPHPLLTTSPRPGSDKLLFLAIVDRIPRSAMFDWRISFGIFRCLRTNQNATSDTNSRATDLHHSGSSFSCRHYACKYLSR